MTLLPVMEEALALLQDGKPVRFMLNGIAAEDLEILQGLKSPHVQASALCL